MEKMTKEQLVANLDRIAKMCAEAYATGLNPLPMLREQTGAVVEFAYYQDARSAQYQPYNNFDGIYIGVSLDVDADMEVAIDLFDGPHFVAEAFARPDFFGERLARVNDYTRYIPELSRNGGAYMNWRSGYFKGGFFSGLTIVDVWEDTSCEMVPGRFVGRMTLAEFLRQNQPQTNWQDLWIGEACIQRAKYHQADEGI